MKKPLVVGLLLAASTGTLAIVLVERLGQERSAPGMVRPEGQVAVRRIGQAELPQPIKVETKDLKEIAAARLGGDVDPRAVAGIVLGPGNRPLPGASVKLLRITSPWPYFLTEELESTLAADNGRFRFRTLRGPNLLVEASLRGFAQMRETAPPGDPQIVIRLARGSTLQVRVEDRNQRPLDGCEVYLEPGNLDTRPAVRGVTDSQGRVEFTDLMPGVVRVTARHPDFQPAIEPSVPVGEGKGGRTWHLRLTERSLSVAGRVTALGRPIAGAIARAYPTSWNAGRFAPVEATSDAQGRFVLRGLGPGNLRIEVRHKEWSTGSTLVAVREDSGEQAVELLPRSTVRGRLTGGRGSGEIELRLAAPGGELFVTRVQPDGTFEFPGRASVGLCTLELAEGDLCFQKTGSYEVTVQVEEDGLTELEVAVAPVGVVRGVVLDYDGRPMRNVRVKRALAIPSPTYQWQTVTITDAEGRFVVRGLPHGNTPLAFRESSRAMREIEVTGPEPGGNVELAPIRMQLPATIIGQVKRGGRALVGAQVYASQGKTVVGSAISGALGHFMISGLPSGEFRLKARYSTLPVQVLDETITVAAGRTALPVQIAFPAGREIKGEVLDGNGQPIAEAQVVVRTASGLPSSTAVTDGRFTLETVAGQDVELMVVHQPSDLTERRVVRSDEDRVRITLPLPPRGTIRAEVVSLPQRRPVTRAILRLEPRELAETVDAQTRRHLAIASRLVEMPSGELVLRDVPAGRARFVLQAPGAAPFVRELEVVANERLDLGTLLLAPGATVRGRVLDDQGAPIAGAGVFLGAEVDLPQLYGAPLPLTDARGEFTLRGVSQHSATLVVTAAGHAPREVALQIPQDLLRSEPLPITLSRGLDLAVRVLDVAGKPLELVTVQLRRKGVVLTRAFTGADGRVTFTERGEGAYDIVLPGYGLWQAAELRASKPAEWTLRVGSR